VMSAPTNGRFTEPAMRRIATRIADRLGVLHDDLTLLRLTNNAVFALPTAGLVIRVTRSHGLRQRVGKVAALGGWFTTVQAPTIRLAADIEQPIEEDGLLATIWAYLPPQPPTPTVDELGRLLNDFHRLGIPSIALPAWDPVGDARARLGDAEALGERDKEFLLQWCDSLAHRLEKAADADTPVVVHGDAHVGNVLRRQDGQPVLCDFDATCLGPWQVDLAAVPVGEVRFKRSSGHRELARAYGRDVTADQHWPLFREARELKMVVAAVPLLASAPGVAQEFSTRLRSVQQNDGDARWTPFADLPR
jgi:hypothetical protein